jgi:4-hydroxy-tetrahydrodipicolinate synthase
MPQQEESMTIIREPWTGVFPAANMPMSSDGAVLGDEFKRHIGWLSSFEVGGVVVNGHAGELEGLTPDERGQAISWAKEASAPAGAKLVAGVTGLNTRDAVACAKDAEQAGADALLVLPLPHFCFAAVDHPELVVPYFEAIASATSLPIIVFRYKEKSGLCYSVPVLLELARRIDTIVGIKDASFDYEAAWTQFQYFDRQIRFLVAHGSHFLIRFRTADGAISSFSNVVPDVLVGLYDLCQQGANDEARELFGRVRALSNAIYGMVPSMQHWPVEKLALHYRGRFSSPVCRPPFQPLGKEHELLVKEAVNAAQLGD